MSGVDIAFLSIAVMLMLIYSGIHVAIALILLSFGGVWLLRGNFDIASNMLVLAFKEDELRDLVAYLRGSRQVALPNKEN